VPVLRYRVSERGWFTDLDGMLRQEIPLHAFRRIPVRVDLRAYYRNLMCKPVMGMSRFAPSHKLRR